ncbi:MAG TPA: hypothetical protein VGE74_22645 [Gemmata sp.]
MSGDWIKMRTDLYRDPKVCQIADALSRNVTVTHNVTRNVMRNATVGALVTVWGIARHTGKRRGDDLVIRGCGPRVVDDIADLEGFGAAMIAVGWLVERDGALVFPRFFEDFNVDPGSDQKRGNAERQRRYRERKASQSNVTGDVTVTSQSNVREEKRREEKSNTPQPPAGGQGVAQQTTAIAPAAPPKPKPDPAESVPIPAALDTSDFRATWADWLAARRAKRRPVTERAARTQLSDLAALGPANAIACIRESIRNDWQGLFPDRFRAGAARAPNLFDRGAAQENRMVAQIAEALAGCPQPQGDR